MGWQRPATGLGAPSVAVHALDLLKEVAIVFITSLAVQGTLKSLLQHHGSKASVLRHSDFFTVKLSHPYVTTGKTITLTRRTFVGKVTSLLLTMLSKLVITFLPRSNFNFTAAITIFSDFGAQKHKV